MKYLHIVLTADARKKSAYLVIVKKKAARATKECVNAHTAREACVARKDVEIAWSIHHRCKIIVRTAAVPTNIV